MTRKEKSQNEVEATRRFLRMLGDEAPDEVLNPLLDRLAQVLKELEEQHSTDESKTDETDDDS